MAFDGNGSFTRPVADYVFDTVISETDMNTEMDGIATGLSNVICKDGQTNPTANLPMASFRHTGVGNASARGHYAAAGQVQDSGFIWCGTAGGTKNALTLSPSPAITAYAAGQKFRFKAGATASDAAVTINVSSVGNKAAEFNDTALTATQVIEANKYYEALYDGTAFQLTRLSLAITTVGAALLDDADAAAQRTTLGLGTAAVEDVATGGTGDLLRADGTLVWAASEITIASGVATPGAGPSFTVDTEADAASDDLDLFDVTSWSDGAIKQFRAESAARTVVLKHDTGTVTATNKRIFLSGDADLSLDDTDKSILLQRRGAEVHEVTRSAAMSPLSESFTSTEQTITAGGLLTLAHGLSSMPLIVVVEAVCQTAENNYAIGDVIVLAPGLSGASDVSTRGFALKKDATNIYIRTHPTTGVNYLDDSTGANVALTAANWKYRVRAWV